MLEPAILVHAKTNEGKVAHQNIKHQFVGIALVLKLVLLYE
jgi:hypothetical protein